MGDSAQPAHEAVDLGVRVTYAADVPSSDVEVNRTRRPSALIAAGSWPPPVSVRTRSVPADAAWAGVTAGV